MGCCGERKSLKLSRRQKRFGGMMDLVAKFSDSGDPVVDFCARKAAKKKLVCPFLSIGLFQDRKGMKVVAKKLDQAQLGMKIATCLALKMF